MQNRIRSLSAFLAAVLGLPVLAVLALASPAGAAATTWSIETSANTGTSENFLAQPSCLSTSWCMAVGGWEEAASPFQDQVQTEHWNGTSWSTVSNQNTSDQVSNDLGGVSCLSTTFCVAAGDTLTLSGFNETNATLIEQWDGTGFSIVSSPNVPDGSGGFFTSRLAAVSCVSATDCTAVGDYGNGTATQTLIEHWDGTSWSIVSSPNPTANDDALTGVSCITSSDCWASGWSEPSLSSGDTLVEHWDGTSWSIVSSPNASGSALDALYGVSCTSSSACMAVGTEEPTLTGNEQTLTERWDGTSWSVEPSQNSSSSELNQLNGVSCTAASACTAVGSFFNGSVDQTEIQNWDGSSWSMATSPNRGSFDNTLGGASCVSASVCQAVGEGSNGTVGQTLAMGSKATPSISSTAGGTVVIGSGSKLSDSATISGGESPTGTLEFILYSPLPSSAVYVDKVTVSGNGTYTTASGNNPGGYLPTETGTYQWVADYLGDGGNLAATTNLGDEPETVSPASPTITSAPGGSVEVGGSNMTDSATLSGGYQATGSITFTLYDPSSNVVDTESASVNGDGTYTTPSGYSPTIPGTYQWVASYGGDTNNNGVSTSVGDEPEAVTAQTSLSYNGATTGHFNDPATLSATLTQSSDSARLSGYTVDFSLNGTETCSGTTNASGVATCTVTPSEAAGSYSVSATFAGSGGYLPSSTSMGFTVQLEDTSLALNSPPAFIANGHSATLSATLTDPASASESETATPIAGKSISFTVGAGAGAQTCSGTTNAGGVATCTIGIINQPLGTGTIGTAFSADAFDQGATASAGTTVFSYLASGSFTIGDLSAVTGHKVTWWSPQWSSMNSLSGGAAPASFKGFAATLSSTPPVVGGTWTTTAGQSPPLPSSVPTYMAVIVTSKVGKSGATIFSGSIAHIAIVQVSSGYNPATGSSGTGTVLGFLP